MDPKDLEFEETLADSELLLKNTARSMDEDAEFTLESILAEYADFDAEKAREMLKTFHLEANMRLKSMSKGTKEKVQLVLVMARKAQLYLLDEPIAGVDPAARDFILRTILTNYNEEGTVLISTHLIADIEKVLDEVILLKDGALMLHESVDHIREERGKSVDALFREIFRAMPMEGGEF